MAKKWMYILGLMTTLTFLCSLTSTFIIIVNENARTELNSNEVLASNNIVKSTSITYDQTNELNYMSLTPGFTQSYTFTISNNYSNAINYSIKWYNVSSTWEEISPITNKANPEEFVYSMSCTNGEIISEKIMPTSKDDLTIIENLELKTNKSNTCTLKVTFKSTGLDQSYNLDKEFKGTYKVVVDK